jgi:hypothetical protein
MTVIPQSSLLSVSNHQRVSNGFHVSLLDKYPQPANSSKGRITLPSSCCSFKENQISLDFRSTDSLNQHISDLEVSLSLLNSMQLLTHAKTIKCHIEISLEPYISRRVLVILPNYMMLSHDCLLQKSSRGEI